MNSLIFQICFLVAVFTGTSKAFADDGARSLNLSGAVGVFVGSFDMPTLGHRAIALGALRTGIKYLYISVIHDSDKDYLASVNQRIQMLNHMFAEYEGRVYVMREPFEGREALARYLKKKHPGRVVGFFGVDTFDKNRRIFGKIEGFEFVKVKRSELDPGDRIFSAEDDSSVVHRMTIDVESGVSSSLGRRLIHEAKSVNNTITQGTHSYILQNLLYQSRSQNQNEAQQSFEDRFRFLLTALHERFGLNYTNTPTPDFKEGQSYEGQNDKFLRQIVRFQKLSSHDAYYLHQKARIILNYKTHAFPLLTYKRIGLSSSACRRSLRHRLIHYAK